VTGSQEHSRDLNREKNLHALQEEEEKRSRIFTSVNYAGKKEGDGAWGKG